MKEQQPPSDSVSLKQGVRQQIEQHQLDDAQLAQLLDRQAEALAATPGSAAEKQRPSRLKARLLGTVASLLLIGWFALFGMSEPLPNRHLTLATEVVKNHLKQEPLQVSASLMPEVSRHFSTLPFTPTQPRWLPAPADSLVTLGSLLGGRYCSIQGEPAAQLRFRQDSRVSTLFQALYVPGHHGDIADLSTGETPDEVRLQGMRVILWREQGLIMALVQPASEPQQGQSGDREAAQGLDVEM